MNVFRFSYIWRGLFYLNVFLIVITILGLFVVFLQWLPTPLNPQLTVYLIYILVIEFLLLSLIIIYRLVRLYTGQGSSKLQQRIVAIMVLLVSAPALVIGVFSMLILDVGLENWIGSRVKTALEESQNIANTYLEEHRQSLGRDMISIARSFDETFLFGNQTAENLENFLRFNTQSRQITQAIIMRITPDQRRQVLARAGFSASLELEPLTQQDISRASRGEIILILNDKVDQARGLVRLRASDNLYLFAGRYVSPKLVEQTAVVKGAVRNFTLLEQQLQELKFGLILTFTLFALLCVIASVYWSLNLARSIAAPIKRLTDAAKIIEQGDLEVKVDHRHLPNDETAQLSAAFNSMAAGLLKANQDITMQRDFIEDILRSVSTGIVSLDAQGRVLSINQRATEILAVSENNHEIDIVEFFPEFSSMLSNIERLRPMEIWQRNLNVTLNDGTTRALLVRLSILAGNQPDMPKERGYIVSLDDVTDLENAQRMAAWSEVAKRIAHEIRNPLTPIRLATERLRRKYLPLLQNLYQQNANMVSERDVRAMHQSTETILRQVDSIANMVREFSDFARIPKANRQPEDIGDICRQAVFIEQNRGHGLHIASDLPAEKIIWPCDRHQMMQLLINLLKNATEAVSESRESKAVSESRGKNQDYAPNVAVHADVLLRLRRDTKSICFEIIDHGPGWPEERERLFAPYHTLRKRGTGLGLAMAQRIVFEHQGECALVDTVVDGKRVGATVRLEFPITESVVPEQNTPQDVEKHKA